MSEKQKNRVYDSAQNFRQALEDRIRNISLAENVPIDRLRKRIAFDRLLARLFEGEDRNRPHWLLKGGYALEVRFSDIARATKDVDMAIPVMRGPSPEAVHEMLRLAVGKDPGDWFEFIIGTVTQDLHLPNYGGWRYPVEARLAGRRFASFRLDVAVGDAVISQPEWQKGSEVLSFAGIDPATIALYPKTQHFAEKIHSFTYPRDKREMSRVKDLVDLVLLIESALPDSSEVMAAIEATFKRRRTHDIPTSLETPPDNWRDSYVEIAEDCGVKCRTVEDAFILVSEYWRNLHK